MLRIVMHFNEGDAISTQLWAGSLWIQTPDAAQYIAHNIIRNNQGGLNSITVGSANCDMEYEFNCRKK
jgi:hypothetical protein